ncbi:MAG: methyltransferase domain-containing protein [Xanthobacteraceae bacterium]
MNHCLICRSEQVETLLDFGPQAVSSHFMKTPDTRAIEHDLAFGVCGACGVMQLANPFPHRDLVRPYDWITYREPESHLDAVVERICSIPGIDAQARVAGITFKDKTTLERLRRRGFDRTWSLDAIDDFGATDANADIESIQALLTPERANEVVRKRGTVDLLIVRHIAEHTEDPRRFMAALATLLAPGGVMVIEIPDCSANLKRQDYSMIWEEHTLYLTPQTAPQLLASAGCAGVAIEVHPFAFEDVIVLYGRKSGAGATQAPLDRETVEPSIDLARRYAAAFEGWTQRYRQLFDGLTADGSRLAAYGAGHLTCAFLNFHGLADYFAFVVDDTPQKQGLFLPKARLPIVSRSRLTADSISACLFGLAPDIEDKVIANNHAYADAGGRFYSMFVDSPRSIRKLS